MTPAELNMQAYRHLFEIENALREFMIDHGERLYGATWYQTVLSSDQNKRLPNPQHARRDTDSRRLRDTKSTEMSRRTIHPLYYADFSAIGEALSKHDNTELSRLFVSGSARLVADRLLTLIPLRHAVAHARPLTHHEAHFISSAHEQIRGELGDANFTHLCSSPSWHRTRDEMSRLQGELTTAYAAIQNSRSLTLTIWPQLRTRWWLSDHWMIGSRHIQAVFRLFEQYIAARESDVVGAARRADEWRRTQWDQDAYKHALNALARDSLFSDEAPT